VAYEREYLFSSVKERMRWVQRPAPAPWLPISGATFSPRNAILVQNFGTCRPHFYVVCSVVEISADVAEWGDALATMNWSENKELITFLDTFVQ